MTVRFFSIIIFCTRQIMMTHDRQRIHLEDRLCVICLLDMVFIVDTLLHFSRTWIPSTWRGSISLQTVPVDCCHLLHLVAHCIANSLVSLKCVKYLSHSHGNTRLSHSTLWSVSPHNSSSGHHWWPHSSVDQFVPPSSVGFSIFWFSYHWAIYFKISNDVPAISDRRIQ